MLFVGVYPILTLPSKRLETFRLLPKTNYKTYYNIFGLIMTPILENRHIVKLIIKKK